MLYTQEGTRFGDKHNHVPESMNDSQHFETTESKAQVRSFFEQKGFTRRFSELGSSSVATTEGGVGEYIYYGQGARSNVH